MLKAFFLGSILLLFALPTSMYAQDLARLRAKPEVERKVEYEQNRHRLEMLLKEWWDMPTDTEIARLDREFRARYANEKPIFYDSLYLDTLYGQKHREGAAIYNHQQITVLGWHPYWMGESYRYYNFKLLTHLVYHSYELNPFTGGYVNFEAIDDFRNSDLVAEAHLDSCKVLLSVSNIGARNNQAFFMSEPIAKQNLVDSLLLILAQSNADGIELNFEDVPIEHKWDFIYFVQELSYAIREFDSRYSIALSLPAQDLDNVYDLGRLRAWVDIFVINAQRSTLEQNRLKKGPMAPLHQESADLRTSIFLNQEVSTLDSILRSELPLDMIEILHPDEHIQNLKDSIAIYIRAARLNAQYNPDNLTELLTVVRRYEVNGRRPLLEHPVLKPMFQFTLCFGAYANAFEAKKKLELFLFKPNADTLFILEGDLYSKLSGVDVNFDTEQQLGISSMIDEYIGRLGEEYKSSLILALPLYGSVWRVRDGIDFEGYMNYGDIRNWIAKANLGDKGLRYDKAKHCLFAEIRDSLGPLFHVYFDNSTSLRRKTRHALDKKLGGIGIWSLGQDYGHVDLWRLLEEEFTTERIYNAELDRYERFRVEKSNKVGFTIRYQLRRYYRLVLATVFIIAIFLALSFGFSLLDWKVRDVMFYSGAFRIFYLALFTVLVLLFGHWSGILENRMSSIFMGVVLGAGLTWLASYIVMRRQERIP